MKIPNRLRFAFFVSMSLLVGCALQLPRNTLLSQEQQIQHRDSETQAPNSTPLAMPETPEREIAPQVTPPQEKTPAPRASDMLAFVRLTPQDEARAALTAGDYGYGAAFEFSQEFDLSFFREDATPVHVQLSFPSEKEIKLFGETGKYKSFERVDDPISQKSDTGITIELKEKGRHLITAGFEKILFEDDNAPEILEQATESISVFENTQNVQRVIQSLNEYGIDPSDRRIGLLCMPGYGMENSEDYSGFGRFLRYASMHSSRRDRFNTTFKPVVFNGPSELPSYENGKVALSSIVYKDKRRYVLFAFSKGGLDSRGMQLADFWNGKRYIAGKVTAGTPHRGSILSNYEVFQARASKEPATLGLCAAYIGATAKGFGALRSTLSKIPIKDIVDKPRGRLWKLGFNDLSYDGVLPEVPVLQYRFPLLSGIEVSRKLTPDSAYLSQCNQSIGIFSRPGSSRITRYYDEHNNCYYNYVQALQVLENEAGLDTVKDTFYHGAYRSGEGLTEARDQFLKKVLRQNGLSSFLSDLSREAKKAAQDFITTLHATMPIYTADRISPFAANDSLVALFSALNSRVSTQSLIDLARSTHISIVIDMVALEARKALNALGQYIWKDRRHSELLGLSDQEDPCYSKDRDMYETYLDNLFALAEKIESEKITTLTQNDRDAILKLFKEKFQQCTSGGKPTICEPKEVKILYTQYNGNNIAKMRVWVDWGQNQYTHDGYFEKIGASWEPYKYEYVPY